MVFQPQTDREWRRFVIALLLAVFVASSATYAGQVYYDIRAFKKWCETASNAAYILAGCWRY